MSLVSQVQVFSQDHNFTCCLFHCLWDCLKKVSPVNSKCLLYYYKKSYIPFEYFYQYFKLCSLYSYINHHQALNTVINNVHFLYMAANILSEISAHSVGSSLATLSITVIICVLVCCHRHWWLWCWCYK